LKSIKEFNHVLAGGTIESEILPAFDGKKRKHFSEENRRKKKQASDETRIHAT